MAVGVSGQGGLMVRCDKAATADLIASSAAQPMEMRGRAMDGWLRVPADAVIEDAELARWAQLGVARAASLPPKGG